MVAFAPPLASPRGVSSHLPPRTGNTGQPGSGLCPSPCRASNTRIFHSPALQRPDMSRRPLKPSRADPRRAEAFVCHRARLFSALGLPRAQGQAPEGEEGRAGSLPALGERAKSAPGRRAVKMPFHVQSGTWMVQSESRMASGPGYKRPLPATLREGR